MQILKASEDYLETMLMMQTKHGYVRSVDVAEHLGVTKPSVTYATKRLRENGYIEMDKDGLITLTDSGMQIAAKMLQRHHTLTNFRSVRSVIMPEHISAARKKKRIPMHKKSPGALLRGIFTERKADHKMVPPPSTVSPS